MLQYFVWSTGVPLKSVSKGLVAIGVPTLSHEKDVIDRRYACLTDQPDEKMSLPLREHYLDNEDRDLNYYVQVPSSDIVLSALNSLSANASSGNYSYRERQAFVSFSNVLRMSYLSQHYGVTWTVDYAVTSFKPARWKVHVNSLRDHGFVGYHFEYRVTLGFGSIAGGIDHVNPIIRLPLEHGISRVLGKDDYSKPSESGVVKLKIEDNVNFEIKSQFMRELREDTFSENKNEDAHDHVDRVLNIGPVPGVTPTQALTTMQTRANHSQKWHDGTSSKNVSSDSNTDGLATIVSKLNNLGCDIKNLKENVHAIQVGCQICKGPHLAKECPLDEEVKRLEEVKYGEFRSSAPVNESNGVKFHVGPPGYYIRIDNRPPYVEKRPSLEELMNKHLEESAQRSTEMK
uniref:Zinc knuckle CX2CX4HX4C n=1 Tax=Tanacetum cinerariifolium TaxID=118510 RepID=A0A6L2M8C3_TANCI|nr:zinc knuckle CX2CX4HX4C [Tanacetum cinerariifolium]